jgi:hypothetical protein
MTSTAAADPIRETDLTQGRVPLRNPDAEADLAPADDFQHLGGRGLLLQRLVALGLV